MNQNQQEMRPGERKILSHNGVPSSWQKELRRQKWDSTREGKFGSERRGGRGKRPEVLRQHTPRSSRIACGWGTLSFDEKRKELPCRVKRRKEKNQEVEKSRMIREKSTLVFGLRVASRPPRLEKRQKGPENKREKEASQET